MTPELEGIIERWARGEVVGTDTQHCAAVAREFNLLRQAKAAPAPEEPAPKLARKRAAPRK